MLGKLLKYEFKATGRVFLPMLGALLIISVINRLFYSLSFDIPSIIGTTISVILIIGIFIITLIITIQRFNKNLLGSEGYLMFTLPVRTDGLIWSKLLVASVWSIASILIVFISISIMALSDLTLTGIADAISGFFSHFNVGSLNLTLYLIEAFVCMVLSLFSGILMLYACISLSMLVNRHRGLCAFLAFIIINTISQILISVVSTLIGFGNIYDFFAQFPGTQLVHIGFIITMLSELVICAIFYIITRYMLNKKLNLE